jgi:Tat pathway signal sequence domain protein
MCERHEGRTSTIFQCGSEPEQKPLLERVTMSRRRFLGLSAAVGAGAGLVGSAGYQLGAQYGGKPSQPKSHKSQEAASSLPPYGIAFGVVSLEPEGYRNCRSTSDITEEAQQQMGWITDTTDGAYALTKMLYWTDKTPPDLPNGVFSGGLIERIAKSYPEKYKGVLGDCAIIAVMINGGDTEGKNYGGLAFQKPDNADGSYFPYFIANYNRAPSSIIAHEVGHLLGPELGKGLGHQLLMPNQLQGEDGELRIACAFDTIQNLLQAGFDLEKVPGDPSQVQQYASPFSVMGRPDLFEKSAHIIPNASDLSKNSRLLFSPPELKHLDPRRKVNDFEGHSETVRYSLSQEFDKRLGVVMPLPADHVLKKILPDIENIFFGPICGPLFDEQGNKIEHPIQKIGVFATWKDNRGTALLETSPFNLIDYTSQTESVNYADSQLGVLVTSGYDLRDGVYIDVRDLNSSESQEILRVERERATERNQIIMNN